MTQDDTAGKTNKQKNLKDNSLWVENSQKSEELN